MIAARLAGGNLFLLFCGGGFLWGIFVGDFWSTRSSSEHSDFFEGIFFEGGFFLRGWWGVFWIVSVGKN